MRNKISAAKASTRFDHFHGNHPGYHLINYLAILSLISGLAVSCTSRSAPTNDATSSATETPGVTVVPYTQDVPEIQTAIAAEAESTKTPEAGASPIDTSAPKATAPISLSTMDRQAQIEQVATTSPPSPTLTADTRLTPKYWREWPIVPTLSAKALQVYQKGLELGNNPHAFSRVGDCQSVPAIFMGLYDDKGRYWLGNDYSYLQDTIDQFAGSFSRQSMAAMDGFGVASVLSPLRANPDACNLDESPIQCEFRIQKPILVFVAMGTNWAPGAEISFEKYLRQIVDFSIEHGVIPILVTKGDNIEKDFKLNEAIARVAYDYDMPLFNAWRAIQFLHNHGLEDNGVYLTVDAWNVRDFTGLQTLDSIWRGLNRETRP